MQKFESRECEFFDYKINRCCKHTRTFPHGQKFKFKCKDGTIKSYDFISSFNDGFATIELNGKLGFIDKDGTEICPIKYEQWYSILPFYENNSHTRTLSYTIFSEGYARVAIKDSNGMLRFGYIDTNGTEICPFIYSSCTDFHNGLAIVTRNGKSVVINKNFKEISKEYDEIYYFVFGFARVRLKNLYGYIDKTGKEICKVKFNSAYNFNIDGLANAIIDRREEISQFIDKNGKEYYMEDDGILYPYNKSNHTRYRYIFSENRFVVL